MSFFRNLGKQKFPYTFFVEVHKITFPRNGLSADDTIVVSFERGDKKTTQSSDHPLTLQPNGEFLCTVDETLSLDVTLYKESNGLYSEKIGKINVYQRRRGLAGAKASKDSLKSIGICSLPLHGLYDGKSYDKVLPLTWTSLEGALVHLTITARPSDEAGDIDNDNESVASSQISRRSFTNAPDARSRQSVSKPTAGVRPSISADHDDGFTPTVPLSAANIQSQSKPGANPAQFQEQRLNTLFSSNATSTTSSSPAPNSVPQNSINSRETAQSTSVGTAKSSQSKDDTDRSFEISKSVAKSSAGEDLESVKIERDQLAAQVAKLSSQLSERKIALDDAKAEVIRSKVQLAAVVQAMDSLKISAGEVIASLAERATMLEVKLAELILSSEPKEAVMSSQATGGSTQTPVTRPRAQAGSNPSDSTSSTSWTPSNVSFSTPSRGSVSNPFASTMPAFDSSIFDTFPTKFAPSKK